MSSRKVRVALRLAWWLKPCWSSCPITKVRSRASYRPCGLPPAPVCSTCAVSFLAFPLSPPSLFPSAHLAASMFIFALLCVRHLFFPSFFSPLFPFLLLHYF